MREVCHETSIRTGSSTITIAHGYEGPEHDPYGFIEYELRKSHDGLKIVFHDGLVTFMTIAGERFHGKAEEICRQFEINLGCSVRHLHRAHQRLVSSCQRCGERKNLKTVDGYPGEKFVVCGACGAVISYDLHPSAIV